MEKAGRRKVAEFETVEAQWCKDVIPLENDFLN
jgi:hypothetical protein